MYDCHTVECAFTSPVRTECGMFVMCCLEEVYRCLQMFSVVNVYFVQLKFCVVCINNGRRYVCCGECYVVSNECDAPTTCLVQLSARTVVKFCTLGVFALGVSLVF